MKIQLLIVFVFTSIIAPSIQYRVTKLVPKQRNEVAQSDINQAPWLVSLRIHGIHYCSGAIVSDNTVVTVGQCIVDADDGWTSVMMKKAVTVQVGSSNLRDNGNIYSIDKCAFGSHYYSKDIPIWDLSMIRINGRFNLKGPGAPKAIPLHYPRPLPEDNIGNVTSWGYDLSNRDGSANLTIKKWSIISRDLCNPYFDNDLTWDQFCAINSDEKVENRCTVGDIGEPLVVDGRLVGLKSYKKDCQLFPHLPSVFLIVDSINFND